MELLEGGKENLWSVQIDEFAAFVFHGCGLEMVCWRVGFNGIFWRVADMIIVVGEDCKE